ncbi:hypothetical protein [Streptomyces sp. NPDC047042]|uniref:hypothetical protein n=1 Tax=Streptomyces sp. NPDC047042 TaxID=3154807 RepID=UPI0033C75D57
MLVLKRRAGWYGPLNVLVLERRAGWYGPLNVLVLERRAGWYGPLPCSSSHAGRAGIDR